MKLRLSDITNLTDARYAAAEGFDWIGFNFIVDTPHVINSLKAKEIKGWLSGPTYFGKFNGKDLSEIRGIAAILSLL
jgi:phosphoribosylanthranilate isomerase